MDQRLLFPFHRRLAHPLPGASWVVVIAVGLLVGCGGPRLGLGDGEARAVYEAASERVKEDPADADAQARLGAAAHRLGRHDEAVRHLSRAAAARGDDAEIVRWYGEALLGAGRPVEAHRVFRRAIELDEGFAERYPKDVEPRLLMALADAAARDAKLLKPAMAIVDSMSPGLVASQPAAASRLYEAQGDFLFSAGSQHEALEAYEKAEKLDASSATLAFKLGRSHAVLHQHDRAHAAFERYISAGDSVARTTEVARFLDERFLFKPALRYYEKAVAARPDDPDLRVEMGTLQLKLRDTDGARKTFDVILDGQKNPAEFTRVARIYLKYDATDAAVDAWSRALKVSPTDVELWKVLAQTLKARGRLGELRQLIGHPDEHEKWGDVFAAISDYPAAAAEYERIARTTPSVQLKLGRVYHQLEQPAKRDAALSRYVSKASDGVAARRQVAALYDELNLSQQAAEAFKALAAADPTDRKSAFALARVHQQAGDKDAEAGALSRWASAQRTADARAEAWLAVAEHWSARKQPELAEPAIDKALEQGRTPSRADALLRGAEIHRTLLRQPDRAEELYQAWIDELPEAKRADARQRAYKLTRYDKSMRNFHVRLLERITMDSPNDADAFHRLGDAYLQMRPRQPAGALRAFERYIELSEDRTRAVLAVGKLLTNRGSHSEAAQIYSRIAPAQVSDPNTSLELAFLYLHGRVNDRIRGAAWLERYLEQADNPGPRQASRLERLANQLVQRGMPELAVPLYERLMASGSSKVRILRPLGRALLALGKEERAARIFDDYLAAQGGRLQAVRNAGDAFYEARFYKRARTYYERTFTAEHRSHLARQFPRLVDVYRKLGDRDGLLDLAQRYVRLTPNARAFRDAATRLQQAGLAAEALEFWGEAARRQPNVAHYRTQQAQLALQLGDVDAAEGYLQGILERSRKPEDWVAAGRLLSDRGYDERAQALYAKALDSRVPAGPIHLARGLIHLRHGRFDDAHEDFVQAISHSEGLDDSLAAIREAYARAGRFEALIDVLRRTVALYPARVQTWRDLADVSLELGRLDDARQYLTRYVDKYRAGATEAAERLWTAGDLTAARRYLEQALSTPMEDGREKAFARLVSLLMAQGRPEELPDAIELYLLNSRNPDQDRVRLAQMMELGEFTQQAIRYYEQLSTRGLAAQAGRRLGLLYLHAGRSSDARVAFANYISGGTVVDQRLLGDQGGVLRKRIQRTLEVVGVLKAIGRSPMALEVLEDELREHPEFAALHAEKALVLLGERRVLEAMAALEGVVRNRVVDGIDDVTMARLLVLVAGLAREREALDVLRRTAPDARSFPLSLGIIELSLRNDDNELAAEELERVLEQSNLGSVRYRLGISYFEAGDFDAAARLFLDVIEPGRGVAEVPKAVVALLVIARTRENDGLVAEATARVGRLYEDRARFHEVMATTLLEAGYHEAAIDHAQGWIAANGVPPSGDELLDKRPSPWRILLTAHLRHSNPDAAKAAAEEYIAAATNPRAARAAAADLFEAYLANDLAYELATRVAEQDKSDRETRLTLGQLALSEGRVEEAETHFQAYLEGSDDRAAARRRVGQAWTWFDHPERAATVLSSLPPTDPAIASVKPLVALRRGDTEEAAKLIDASIDAASDPLVATVRYAATYLREPAMPAPLAMSLADRALALRPKQPHPVAQLVKACALVELGRADEGRRLVEVVVSRGGADVLALYSQQFGMSGEQSSVRATYGYFADRALRSMNVPMAIWSLDRLVADTPLEGASTAIDKIRKALARDGWSDDARTELVNRAIEYLDAMRLRPRDVAWAVGALSELYERRGDLEAALHVYRKAIERYPGEELLYNNLAYVMSRHEVDLEEALAMVRRAIALSPSYNLAYLDTEGWILYKLGRYDEAVGRLEESLRYLTAQDAPGLSEIFYHLGMCYQKLGQLDRARRELERARRQDADSEYGRLAAEALRSLGK